MLPISKTLALSIVVSTLSLLTVNKAQADDAWAHHHPRRTEVLDRAHHLNARINEEAREGEISPARAAALHWRVRQVVGRENWDAMHQGGVVNGYISQYQQQTLNRRESMISQEIGR